MDEVTPNEIARSLGVTGRTFRGWLRAQAAAGHPLLARHTHGARWCFTRAEATQLAIEFRSADEPMRRRRSATVLTTATNPAPLDSLGHDAPSLPTAFTRDGLSAVGFAGWRSWAELRANRLSDVPCDPGVYVVARETDRAPEFDQLSPAGHFKGEDPSVSVTRLEREWVPGAYVVYIGKAGRRAHLRTVNGLRERLTEYSDFGAGAPVAHRGGRLIWQLADRDTLVVAWHPVTWGEDARGYEKRLLSCFADHHDGRRPFANLTG